MVQSFSIKTAAADFSSDEILEAIFIETEERIPYKAEPFAALDCEPYSSIAFEYTYHETNHGYVMQKNSNGECFFGKISPNTCVRLLKLIDELED